MKSKKEATSRNGFLLYGPDTSGPDDPPGRFPGPDGQQYTISDMEYGRDPLFYEDLLPYFQFCDLLQKNKRILQLDQAACTPGPETV